MEYTVENLLGQINELRGVIQSMQIQQMPQGQVATVQYVIADPVAMPDRFSGSRSSYNLTSFRLAVERVFELSGGRFPNDRSKVTFIGNLLDGPARRWFDSVEMTKSEESLRISHNINYFWESMAKHFGLKDSKLQSELKLIKLKQQNLSVSEYGIRYKQMASTLEFNERALVAIFIANLNDQTLDFLKRQSSIPEQLDELIQLCVRVDNDYLDPKGRTSRPHFAANEQHMDVGVIAENRSSPKFLCNFCKLPGHIKRNCPKLNKSGFSPKASATH